MTRQKREMFRDKLACNNVSHRFVDVYSDRIQSLVHAINSRAHKSRQKTNEENQEAKFSFLSYSIRRLMLNSEGS